MSGWGVVAPIGKTLVIMLLVGIARVFTAREAVHIFTGAVPLGLVHALEGASIYDAGGHALVSVLGFLVFSFVYVVWRRTSR